MDVGETLDGYYRAQERRHRDVEGRRDEARADAARQAVVHRRRRLAQPDAQSRPSRPTCRRDRSGTSTSSSRRRPKAISNKRSPSSKKPLPGLPTRRRAEGRPITSWRSMLSSARRNRRAAPAARAARRSRRAARAQERPAKAADKRRAQRLPAQAAAAVKEPAAARTTPLAIIPSNAAGCSCSTETRAPSSPISALLAMSMLALAMRRRRG